MTLKQKNITHRLILFFLSLSLSSFAVATQHVLLLQAYTPLFPISNNLTTYINQALKQQRTSSVELHVQFMNTDLGARREYLDAYAHLLETQQHYDLVIAVGDSALNFAATEGQRAFKNTPIVFLNIATPNLVKQLQARVPITGVMNVPPIYELMALTRHLYPHANKFYAITDALHERDDRLLRLQQVCQSLNLELHTLSLAELSWDELAQKLSALNNQPVLLLSAYRDHTGVDKFMPEAVQFLTQHSASPIWHLRQAGIGLGLAGGVVTDLQKSSDLAVALALKILAGQSAENLPIHWQPPMISLVDLAVMQAHGFTKSQFPQNITFLNEADSFWQRQRIVIVIGTLVIAALSLLLALWLREKRRHYFSASLNAKRAEIMQSLLDASPNMISYKDINGHYEFFNTRFTTITRGNPQGKTDYDLFDTETADFFRSKDQEAIDQGQDCINEEWVLDEHKRPLLLQTHKTPIYNTRGVIQGILGFSLDITEYRQTQERLKQLEHFTLYDSLTNLPNKKQLHEQLGRAILDAQQTQQLLAVIYLDLDRFKDINDTLGHDTGDELLKMVSQRLHSNIHEADICSRLGSDEFIIVLTHPQDYRQAQEKCEQLLALVARPYSLQNHLISIYASAGICLYPNDGEHIGTLIRNADAALHKAKELGRNRCHRYSPELTNSIHSRMALEQDLHTAMEKRQFHLVFQPQIKLPEQSLHGVEALVRWQHPSRGLISPAEFIPLAESSGMMVELGYWILRSACQQFLFWREQGLSIGKIAVNLSPVQITHNFAEKVIDILATLNFNPQWLELEVTEGLMMSDTLELYDQIYTLKRQGIEFSVDDFGTGYSSLSKLKSMPVSVLKIDQSFVQNISTDKNDFKIVQAIIQMAKSLNLTTVAEGVESLEHAQILQQLGCDIMQGYYYAKPMPANELFDHYR